MWYRADLKQKARACLRENYWPLVLVSLILWLISGQAATNGFQINLTFSDASMFSLSLGDTTLWSSNHLPLWLVSLGAWFWLSGVAILLVDLLLLPPLTVGCHRYFLTAMDERPTLDCLLQNFQQGYWNTVKIMFLRELFTLLWGLLLIIPGIVKNYEYRMIPYLLAEYPEMSREEVFEASRYLMDGQKLNAFILDLSFLGWIILSSCTFGLLGILYVIPYRFMTNAQLYRALCRAGQFDGPIL